MKNIIESVLVKHLGKYVQGLKNSLDIGLINGEVTIENVGLKASFINELGLPFSLKYSHIQKIHIDIPWTNLKQKSTIVTIRGVYMLVKVNYEQEQNDFDPQERLKSIFDRVRMEIKKKWQENSNKQETFAEKNLIRIVDNLVLNINNIHLRMQSFRRNWDYSIGVIMDNVNSYTINEYDQKCFYTRSFSKKQTNKKFRKILNVNRFQIYFNDDQKTFISNEVDNQKPYILKMMAHPFPQLPQQKISPKKKMVSDDSIQKAYPTYETKRMTNISLTATGTQTFAEDFRYIINLGINVHAIDFSISNRQLSQLVFCMEHFYEFGLNIFKNGKKGFNFSKQISDFYRITITKIAKDEKISANQTKQLLSIISECPMNLLESINDQIINNVKFENEMKKISKVTNVQKSKKLMQGLLDKKQKLQAMEGVQIFKEVIIQCKIGRIIFILLNKNIIIAETGLMGLELDTFMSLNGEIRLSLNINNCIFKSNNKEITQDLYDKKKNYIQMYLDLKNKDIKKLQFSMLKKQINLKEQHLFNLFDWISLIRIKPSLVNFIDEQLNYSIDLTRVFMQFLFTKNRHLYFLFQMPLVRIEFQDSVEIQIDFGNIVGKNIQNNTQFLFTFEKGQTFGFPNTNFFSIQNGSQIRLIDRENDNNFQMVKINLKKIKINNTQLLINVLSSLKTNKTLKYYNNLDLLDTEEEQLDGQFYLNRIKKPQAIFISKNKLLFLPSQQIISLVRTKVYQMIIEGRYFLVFKEEVNKDINIIEIVSNKLMQTVFIKMKEYIHQICTSFQWQKYYKQLYKDNITHLSEIQQKNQKNQILMILNIHLDHFSIQLSQNNALVLLNNSTQITYNQFNTEASVKLQNVNLIIQKQKIIYDASFKISYQYLQSMIIQFEVLKMFYRINLYSTFSTVIDLSSKYQLLISSLRKQQKIMQIVQEDDSRLEIIKTKSQIDDGITKFLLERKIKVETEHIEGYILGYKNNLDYILFESNKYRNQAKPRFEVKMKGVLLLSMINIPYITAELDSKSLNFTIDSINIQINMAIIIYQIIKGEGSILLKQIIKTIKNKKIAEKKKKINELKQDERMGEIIERIIKINISQFRIEIALTQGLSIGANSANIEFSNHRISWTTTLFWLNGNCISMNENNGIIKRGKESLDICMTNFKLKLNSKEVLQIYHQIKKIVSFIKNNNFDLINLVQKQLEINDGVQVISSQELKIQFNIRIEQFQIIYECSDKNPLLSIRSKPLFYTNVSEVNSLNLSVWHFNRGLKLYEPIIQPFELKVINREISKQIEIMGQKLMIIITQQFLINLLEEIKLLQEINVQLCKVQINQFQTMNTSQIQKDKNYLEQQNYQQYDLPDFNQKIEYSSVLKIVNHLNTPMLIEVSCGKKKKQLLIFDSEDSTKQAQTKIINIPQKTSYNYSYELIQRYQRVELKVSIVNRCYSMRSQTFSFLLYDDDNYYIHPITLVDDSGIDFESNFALKVTYQEGIYLIDLLSKYSILNQTNVPIYFRYSDNISINKFLLQKDGVGYLPLWTINYVTFGFTENNYTHVLQLKPKQLNNDSKTQAPQEAGSIDLSVGNSQEKALKTSLLIKKNKLCHKQHETPKLDSKKLNEFSKSQQNQKKKQDLKEEDKQQKQKKLSQQESFIFQYSIIPALLIHNHLNFIVKINQTAFQFQKLTALHQTYFQNDRQYIKISLGDHSYHEVYIPEVNAINKLILKLTDDNYVTVSINARKNSSGQKILHIYADIHLLLNTYHFQQPTLIANIYNHNFIIKKIVRNNDNDRIHPSPLAKDKFIFTTYHYLLQMEQKYITVKTKDFVSNQIIMYESDFNKDLIFQSENTQIIEYVYAVSYQSKSFILESEDNKNLQTLECYYAYIMPKYYIINHSETNFIVNGNGIIRSGQKLVVNKKNEVDFKIQDHLELNYVEIDIDKSNFILFIQGSEQIIQLASLITQKSENTSINLNADQVTKLNQQQMNEQNRVIQKLEEIKMNNKINLTEISEKLNEQKTENQIRLQQQQPNITQIQQQIQQVQQSKLKYSKHLVSMQNIKIYSLNQRMCQYQTVTFEISDWTEWLTIKNDLEYPIIARVQLITNTVGFVIVQPFKSNQIISGLSQQIEFSIIIDNQELYLGIFLLNLRLNHEIILFNCPIPKIIIKESKVKKGRFISFTNPQKNLSKSINKVQQSFIFTLGTIGLSIVLFEDKIRRQLLRAHINHFKITSLYYKNTLYMLNFEAQNIIAYFKKQPMLLIKEVKVYLEGYRGQFIERLFIDSSETIEILLTDQFIIAMMLQLQYIEKYIPTIIKQKTIKNRNSQEEETFHINSLSIKSIEIKLSVKRLISNLTEQKKKLLSGFSLVEIQDAFINLSAVQIEQPLKQKHINGMSKMYTMESFVGIASGLNILGNPSQFVNQFEAGRNRGGVFAFFGSIVAGTTNSLSKIIGTIGSGVSQLTFDQQFQKNRIVSKNIKVNSFGMGFKVGMKQLANSLKSSITGLIMQPIQGHHQQGGIGIVKGTLAGLTGLITKPLTGIIFAASKTIEGISSSATYLDSKLFEDKQLITRPLYHKFKLIRPYKNQDYLAYNIMLNWYNYQDVQLIGGYLLQAENEDSIIQILIITCSQLILIDLNQKAIILSLKNEELIATGQFTEGVALSYKDGSSEYDQDDVVFHMRNDIYGRDNLYWTLKAIIGLYAQKQH